MKLIMWIALTLSYASLTAEQNERTNPFPQEWIAPLLPLNETPPVELNDSNREKLQMNYSEENREILQSKAFPWIYILSALAIVGALAITRVLLHKSPLSSQSAQERL